VSVKIKKTLLVTVRGSYAYGTNTDTSDKDYFKLVVPEIDYVLGLSRFRGQQIIEGENDFTIHTLYDFVHGCLNGRTALIEVLFVRDKDILEMDHTGQKLVAVRNKLLSQRLAKPFMGFACTQWRKTLNGNKCRFVPKLGYDPKSAYHAVRVLFMACRFKQTGTLNSFIYDDRQRQECIEIKEGRWTCEQVVARIEQLVDQFDNKLSWHPDTPKAPDYDFWNQFVINGYCEALELKGA
jgi:predicted nucleotidyltransferase